MVANDEKVKIAWRFMLGANDDLGNGKVDRDLLLPRIIRAIGLDYVEYMAGGISPNQVLLRLAHVIRPEPGFRVVPIRAFDGTYRCPTCGATIANGDVNCPKCHSEIVRDKENI